MDVESSKTSEDTVELRFSYFNREMGRLGMMANKAQLLWNDFFNQAVDEKISKTLDPENEKRVDQEIEDPVLERRLNREEEAFAKDLVFLSFQFPVERLALLERAANKLNLERNVFIQTAVFEKIDHVEVEDYPLDEDDKETTVFEDLEKIFETFGKAIEKFPKEIRLKLWKEIRPLQKGVIKIYD